MGLDMYVITTNLKPSQPVDFDDPRGAVELHYWRKHPNLHGWFEKLYRAKGGANSDFNLTSVLIESDDLDRLEAAITSDALPFTEGFFFGVSRPHERADDLAFLQKARRAMAEGKSLYYFASW